MTDKFPYTDVIRILQEDTALLRSTMEFADLLSVPITQYANGLQETYDKLKYILESWKSLSGAKANVKKLSEILRKNKFVSSAEKLEAFDLKTTQNSTISQLFPLPKSPPCRRFIRRENEFRQCLDLLQKENILFITGTVGVGKTVLALHLAMHFCQSGHSEFIRLDGKNRASILDSLTTYNRDSRNLDTQINKLLDTLHDRSVVLLIDNLVEITQSMQTIIKLCSERHSDTKVLITRRENIIDENVYHLNGFTKPDAIKFLRARFKNSVETELIKVCEKCAYNPSDINHLSNLIKSRRRDISELNSYKEARFLHIMSIETHLYSGSTFIGYTEILNELVRNNSSQMRACVILLKILSISRSNTLREDFINKMKLDTSVEECTEELVSMSLIHRENGVIQIPYIVQVMVKNRMLPKEKKSTAITVFDSFKTMESIECLEESDYLVDFWRYTVSLCDKKFIHKTSNVPSKIAERLLDLSAFQRCQTFCEEQVNFVRQSCPETDVNLLALRNSYATCLATHSKRTPDALKEYKNIKICQLLQSPQVDLENLCSTRNNIAVQLMKLGKYKDALDELREVLRDKKEIYGENSGLHVIPVLTNIALCHQHLGNNNQAIQIYRRLLRKTSDGNIQGNGMDRERFEIQYYLASCLFNCDNSSSEAKELLKSILTDVDKAARRGGITRDNFNWKFAPTRAEAQVFLARIYKKYGKQEKARDLVDQALQCYVTLFDEDHADVVECRELRKDLL